MQVSIVKNPVHIVLVDFATDNSAWSSPINSAFKYYLDRTQEDISFTELTWTNRTDNGVFLERIKSLKPDVVFLPDYAFYRMFAKDLAKLDIHISTFFLSLPRHEVLDYANQSGVFNEYPSDKIVEFARQSFKVEKIAILGGPYANDVIQKITAPLQGLEAKVEIDSFIEGTWLDYKERLLTIEKEYDAVWLLMPFGVKDGDNTVDFKKLEPVARQLKIPSFGFGGTQGVPRTITIGLVQEKIGQYCATLVYSAVFKRENKGIKDYTSYELLIDTEHALKLGLKITDEMANFLRG